MDLKTQGGVLSIEVARFLGVFLFLFFERKWWGLVLTPNRRNRTVIIVFRKQICVFTFSFSLFVPQDGSRVPCVSDCSPFQLYEKKLGAPEKNYK